MKILLFGQNGQVGWELRRSLAPLGEVIATDRATVSPPGDLADVDGVRRAIRDMRPDVVVNAAAYTAVDRAESEPELCHRINALAPEAMAAECATLGAWFVHYSTDYVFDGSGERPWREDDAPAPLGAYGRSKAEAEVRIAATGARHLVFRTSWVYADRGANFMATMLRLGQERDRLTVVHDQHGAPTGADLIADVTAHAVLACTAGRAAGGLYHLVADGETSWLDYAALVFQTARDLGRPVRAVLEGIPTSAYPTPARRPHNSRLDHQKLERQFGLRMPPWQQGVRRAVALRLGRAAATPG